MRNVLDYAKIATDLTDYKEYLAKCADAQEEPLDVGRFAQNVGMILVARKEFPGMSDFNAYTLLVEAMNTAHRAKQNVPEPVVQPEPKPCGGCPGSTPPDNSRGLGDTVYKITHATGLDKLAEIYTKITGKPCGCDKRQDALNKLFPYGIKEE